MAKQQQDSQKASAKKTKISKNAWERLRRVVGRDVVSYRDADGRRRVIDTARRASLGNITNTAGKLGYRGGHIQASTYGTEYQNTMQNSHGKAIRYAEYDRMDGSDPIIHSALDIYADESTLPDELGRIITIDSENDEIKRELENLFFDVLDVEYNLWGWTRMLCKYGDFYLFMELSETTGLTNVIPISPNLVDRVEMIVTDTDGERKFPRTVTKFVIQTDDPIFQFKSTHRNKNEFDNFELIHFRMLGDTNFLPYGKSMIEGARITWQQLTLMEDAMLIHRVVRSPDRRIYSVEVGNAELSEISRILEDTRNRTKRVPHFNEMTGQYNLRFALNNLMEDLYVATRGGREVTTVDTLPGLQYTAIEDIEYLQNKLFSSLKIPKAFLGYEESLNSKATLASEDVRFARTIARIQRTIVPELKKLGMIHLLMQGYELHDAYDFDIEMNTPSTIFEREKIELQRDKFGLVDDLLRSGMVSRQWIYEHILEMTDDEMTEEKNNILKDALYKYKIYKLENEGTLDEDDDGEMDTGDVESGYSPKQSGIDFGNPGASSGGEAPAQKKQSDTSSGASKDSFKGGSPLAQEGFIDKRKRRKVVELKDLLQSI